MLHACCWGCSMHFRRESEPSAPCREAPTCVHRTCAVYLSTLVDAMPGDGATTQDVALDAGRLVDLGQPHRVPTPYGVITVLVRCRTRGGPLRVDPS
jgi:hypothetical protein